TSAEAPTSTPAPAASPPSSAPAPPHAAEQERQQEDPAATENDQQDDGGDDPADRNPARGALHGRRLREFRAGERHAEFPGKRLGDEIDTQRQRGAVLFLR